MFFGKNVKTSKN